MGLNYKGFFKDWEVAIAKSLVNEFQSKWKLLEQEGFDDLLQECLTHWYFIKDKYDPNREASCKTFMSRVVKNKLTNIVKNVYANKRKTFYQSVSLEEPLGSDADALALIETISENDDILQTQLKIDLPKALMGLTTEQKRLCSLLGEDGLNIKEASERLKIPRSTIYEEIKRIRKVFREKSLENYFK